jgi:hypothetical protein
MAAIGSIDLEGESARVYTFNIYPVDTEFKDIGAVYVFTRAVSNSQGGNVHSILYVGQTSELGTRLSNHHKGDCVERNGANRICVRVTTNQNDRLVIEDDLCKRYQPTCNDQLVSASKRTR